MFLNPTKSFLKILCSVPLFLFGCTDGSVGPDDDYASDRSFSGKLGGGESGSNSGGGSGTGEILPGQITAGEWKDTDNWGFWSNLMQNEAYGKIAEYWDFNLQNRIDVLVENEFSVAMNNIPIKLLTSKNEVIWESKTDNRKSYSLGKSF